MIDDSGPNFYQPPDYRFYGWLDALTPERRVPDHVEEVIGHASDKKSCLICREAMAARLVPSERVLPLLDPVFNFGTTIVDLDYLFRFDVRVGYDESDTGKEFAHMPFYLTDNPSGLVPFLGLIIKLDHPYQSAALWRTTCGPLQVRLDELLQDVVAGKTDEVSDPLLFAKLIEVWTGKSRIPTDPKALEPRPVALNQRGDEIQDAIG
jgi:hypothetical protein